MRWKKTRQGKTRQDKARGDKTRRDKTRQDKTATGERTAMATKAPTTSSSFSSPSPPFTTTDLPSLANVTISKGNMTPPRRQFWTDIITSMQVVNSLEITTNILLNLLLLAAILSSPLLRSRMRNRLVINVTAANLLVGVLLAPVLVDYTIRRQWVHNCFITVTMVVLCVFVQNFISAWGVVAILLHYLARLLRYEGPACLERRLSPGLQRALPAVLIASPWIVSAVVLVPMVFAGLSQDVLTVWSLNACPFIMEPWARPLLNAASYFLPALVLVLLVLAILRLRLSRGRGEGGEDSASKVESGGHPPPHLPDAPHAEVMSDAAAREDLEACWVHVLTAALTVLLLGPEHIFVLFRRGPARSVVVVSIVFRALGDFLLPALMPLAWLLLLPDVRQRVKEMAGKVAGYLPLPLCCRSQSPPEASGATSVAPVAFRDLSADE